MGSKARLGAVFVVVSVALAPTLSACGGFRDAFPRQTVTATATPTTTPTTSKLDALRAWHEATLVPAQELRDATAKISTAAAAYDLTSMGIACQEAHDAVESFQQHMPSPDPELTAQLQKALSDYGAGATICTTAVENRNLDDFAQGGTLIREANTYMDNAVKILDTDLGQSSNSAAPPSPSSPSNAANAADPEADSLQQLRQLASSDRPFVTASLTDSWIPQLSSKRSSEPWTVDPENGVTYDPVRILQEHQQLRGRYPGEVRLLWSGNWSTFSDSDFWITVVADTFPEAAGALAWCSSHGLDRDHCAAKIVSTTHGVEGSTAYN
jgi:hypothetical protein